MRLFKTFSESLRKLKLLTGSGVIAHYVSDLRNNYPHLNIFHLDVRSEPLEKLKTLTRIEVSPIPILNDPDRTSM